MGHWPSGRKGILANARFHQGDIVWLDFDPHAGHEEGKRRPAIIVSGNDALARIKPLAFVSPITSAMSKYPTHVGLDSQTKTRGTILCEQTKALDLEARNAGFIEVVPDEMLQEVLDIIHSLLD